jgi:hypothetical protein
VGADDITLVSSTDSDEQVAAALAGPTADTSAVKKPAAPETPAPAAPATPEVPATPETPAAEVPPVVDPSAEPVVEPVVEPPKPETNSERRARKIQAQIDDATRRKHDAARAADAEEARYKELKAKREALEATPAAVPAADKRPQLADLNADGTPTYANYEEWVEASHVWSEEKATKAIATARTEIEASLVEKQTTADRARIEHDTAARAEQDALASYETHLVGFRATHADFDAVLASATEHVAELVEDYGPDVLNVVDRYAIYDADNGPAINHFLAAHPDELRRIVALPVPQQLAALGKLDERLNAATSTPAPAARPAVSSAPAPIKPVGGSPTSSTVSPEDESYTAYKARREREERVARGLPA